MSDYYPKVLVGGFARTGTSALTMLIAGLGFEPGKGLKRGAASNPRRFSGLSVVDPDRPGVC